MSSYRLSEKSRIILKKILNTRSELIKCARALLSSTTPASFDCGKLCDKLCCKGNGLMRLLPGEYRLYAGDCDNLFTVIRRTESNNIPTDLIRCNGSCDTCRDRRPFYCRVYPYFPYVNRCEDGDIMRIAYESDALRKCPLTNDDKSINKDFQAGVFNALELLCDDASMLMFFISQGDFILNMRSLARRFAEDETKTDCGESKK